MTKEEIFAEAEISYNNCKLIIDGLNNIIKAFIKDFNADNQYIQFDLLLQALLFSEAIADGNFCEEEKEFIQKLAQNTDLFQYVTSDVLKDLSWDKVFAMSADEQSKLADELNEVLNVFADDFVLPFAILDAATTQNSLMDLSSCLCDISNLLGSVDGELSQEELYAFQKYSDELILGKWADIKGLTEVLIEEGSDEDTPSEENGDEE